MLKLRRRDFLRLSALAGGSLMIRPGRAWSFLQSPTGIHKFTIPLPGLGPTGIPVATPDTAAYPGNDYYTMVAGQFRQVFHPDFLSIYGGNFPGTTLWGYASENPKDLLAGGALNHRYLGGFIVAKKGRPVRMQMRNRLVDSSGAPLKHPLPVDLTVMDALVMTPQDAALENRIAVHFHGGHVPWISDGGPFAWFGTPDPVTGIAPKGASLINVPGTTPPEGAMTFYYPTDEPGRLYWYHDHAYGLTRLNAYAGLASGFLVLDQAELNLINAGYIPNLARQVPLIIQDKSFIPPQGTAQPGQRGQPGDLFYASDYEGPPLAGFGANITTFGGTTGFQPADTNKGRWDWSGPGVATSPNFPPPSSSNPPQASAIAEFFADISVINGACYPFQEVEQRRYRFRILNAAQARFFNLQLYYADGSGTEIPLVPDATGQWMVPDLTKVRPGPKIIQIGNESGFFPFPVELNNPPAPLTVTFNAATLNPNFETLTHTLLMAPAERADIIINFAGCPVGSKLILYSDAPAPFPGGDPRNDYYTGMPDYTNQGGSPGPAQGFGPNTRTLMQFVVKPRVGAADPPQMALLEKYAVKLNGPVPSRGAILPQYLPLAVPNPANPGVLPAGVTVRQLALYEDFDAWGRLRQRIGPLSGAIDYTGGPGEIVKAGSTEVWEIYNTTGDTHPMHFHLVDVNVLARGRFVPDLAGNPTGTIDPATGNLIPTLDLPGGGWRVPDNNELGGKETVRMNPGEVIRVIMQFELAEVPFVTPNSPRMAAFNDPATGQPLQAHEYVWHCHILEHEEHDMMHAMSVVP